MNLGCYSLGNVGSIGAPLFFWKLKLSLNFIFTSRRKEIRTMAWQSFQTKVAPFSAKQKVKSWRYQKEEPTWQQSQNIIFLYPLGFLSTNFSMCSHPSESLYSTFSNIRHTYKFVQTTDCQVWSSCGNPWACGSLDPSTKNPSPTWLYRPLRFTGWALNTVLIFLVHKARQSSCCQTGVFVFWMIRTLTCSQFRLIINTLDILLSLKEERIKNPSSNKVC